MLREIRKALGGEAPPPQDEMTSYFRYAVDEVFRLAAFGGLALEVMTATGTRILGPATAPDGLPEGALVIGDVAVHAEDIVALKISAAGHPV